jgi:hypothetical protein
MADDEDGYSEIGGGGSVHWKIDMNDTDLTGTNHDGRRYLHYGVDRPNQIDEGKYFEISIKEPEAGILMKRLGDRVVLYVPIERDKKQIKVSWVKSSALATDGTKPLM